MEAMFRRWHKSLFRREFNLCKNRRLSTHFHGFLKAAQESQLDDLALLIGLDSMEGVNLASGACPARSRKEHFLTDLLPHLGRYRRRRNRRRQFEENFLQPPGKLSWSQPGCSQALPTLRDSG